MESDEGGRGCDPYALDRLEEGVDVKGQVLVDHLVGLLILQLVRRRDRLSLNLHSGLALRANPVWRWHVA